jgi:phage shock protein PspC (stress-responsive transcriptional regulator)
MNKTLSVNIGGIVFHIEELAYDKLNRYLESIKGCFTTSDGRDEIMQDIEARLGEMFQERLTPGKQVIIDSDVEHVIQLMGKPEQFAAAADENSASSEGPSMSNSERKSHRRLYRDSDDRVIGGVCSGFSHYLGLDPIWLRLAFAVAFFAFGSGLLLYIILMIIMPKARTTAEKLEMKGEKVNISNIRKSVEEEMGAVKSRIETSGAKSGIANFFDSIGELIIGALRLIGKIIAGFFAVIGFIILIAFAVAFLAILGVGTVTVPFFITDMVMEPWQQMFAVIGGFLVIGIPVIMIIYKAVKVLFKIKTENRALNWTAMALWIVGLGLSIIVGSSVGSEFRTKETDRAELQISQPVSDTLNLKVADYGDTRFDWHVGDDDNNTFPFSSSVNEDSVWIRNVRLDIVKSNSGQFELTQIVSSRGENRRQAFDNARKVNYSITQDDNSISFDESFLLDKGAKFRGQKVQLVLRVPEGKSVVLTEEMVDIIYDIKNVTNTYDGDMVGRTWTMTSQGLECIGCGLPDRNRRVKREEVRIRINDQGVRVDGADANSDSSIVIDGEDVSISIDDSGVRIDAKKK